MGRLESSGAAGRATAHRKVEAVILLGDLLRTSAKSFRPNGRTIWTILLPHLQRCATAMSRTASNSSSTTRTGGTSASNSNNNNNNNNSLGGVQGSRGERSEGPIAPVKSMTAGAEAAASETAMTAVVSTLGASLIDRKESRSTEMVT